MAVKTRVTNNCHESEARASCSGASSNALNIDTMSSTADPGGFLAIEAAFYVPDSKKESPIKQNERYYIQDTAIVVFQARHLARSDNFSC